MSWGRRIYPVLFAVYPIVAQGARNPGYISNRETLSLSLVFAAVAALAYVLAYPVAYVALRRLGGRPRDAARDAAGDVAALMAFAVAVALWEPLGFDLAYSFKTQHRAAFLALFAVGALLCVVALARRWYRKLPPVAELGRYFTIVGTLLVGFNVAQIALAAATARRQVRQSALVRRLEAPVPLRGVVADTAAARTGKRRDVYVVLLDEYAASSVWAERFGYDNRPFEDSLRALGFRVPASVRSNYANTLLSVSSLLNFEQLTSLADAVPAHSRDFTPAMHLLEYNRAARFLKSQGYRFEFFPSAWYGPTHANAFADEEFAPYHDVSPSRLVNRSADARYIMYNSLFRHLGRFLAPQEVTSAEHASRTLDGIAEAARRSKGPTFVFAHVLMPHVPYIVDASCRTLVGSANAGVGNDAKVRAAVAGEMTCLNRRLLAMARTIIASADPKPIIILQGDHGTQSLSIFADERRAPTEAQLRERFRAFGAYYLPDGGGAAVPDSTSIVNVMRYVFDYYFGADLPPLPNTMYYSHWKLPYAMTEVSPDFRLVSTPSTTRSAAR